MRAGAAAFLLAGIGTMSVAALADTPIVPTVYDSYRAATATVERALRAHGYDALLAAGKIEMTLRGELDLTTRLQGFAPAESSKVPVEERISVDLARGAVAYDLHWFNYVHSKQRLREVYDPRGRVLYVDITNGSAGWDASTLVPDLPERYTRLIPTLLLRDALDHKSTLRDHGERRYRDRQARVVSYSTAGGDEITLYVSESSALLLGAETLIDMPIVGDATLHWMWSDYMVMDGVVNGAKLPTQLSVYLNNDLLKQVTLSSRLEIDETAFAAPEEIDTPEPPEPEVRSPSVPAGQQPSDVRELAPGVFAVINLRPGFHVVFVEFDDFVLAVDAPTGWYEMQQLPPMNWSVGDTSNSLGRKFLRAIKDTIPDKPVRYLVLTHHHSDHIGGLRPFLADGVSVLSGESASVAARQAARAKVTLAEDEWQGTAEDITFQIVQDQYVIADAANEVRLIELPDDNPHARDFLVVYLPKQKLMYLTAFIYPLPEGPFPPTESIPGMKWFVDWLDDSGLEVEILYNVHGIGRVRDWHLDYARKL